MAQLTECWPSKHETLSLILAAYKLGMAVNVCKHYTQCWGQEDKEPKVILSYIGSLRPAQVHVTLTKKQKKSDFIFQTDLYKPKSSVIKVHVSYPNAIQMCRAIEQSILNNQDDQ